MRNTYLHLTTEGSRSIDFITYSLNAARVADKWDATKAKAVSDDAEDDNGSDELQLDAGTGDKSYRF